MRLALCLIVAAALMACTRSTAQTPGQPLETRPPNAEGQTPAFPGQTRAPYRPANVAYEVKEVAKSLDHPWGLAFLPDGRMLVTERAGRLRIVSADGALSEPVGGLPPIDARGQGGLLDVALDPAFASNHLIYWTYAQAGEGGTNGTAAARGRLVDGPQPKVEAVEIIYSQEPKLKSTQHFGGRLAFAPDGKLFITTGDRFILEGRRQAERTDGDLGKVIRINADGSIPKDNPFVGKAGARPALWSIGHRNVQAAAINPRTGALWTVEHGAQGGDEINRPQGGKDYGWPTITYGEDYGGGPIGDGITAKAGLEQPLYYWDPVIAPSGMAFYEAALFPAWKGSLFIGALKQTCLVRLTLDGDKVTGEEHLLTDLKERIRDVRVGPDGAVYVLTDSKEGRILKLVPKV